jgi:hypothetical protein
MRTRGAAPTSPPEGVLRHMRHQERVRAVGTHYGPTRIYGPTGDAIEGTAAGTPELLQQITCQASALPVTTTGRPAATCRSMDLAAAVGARATRMSRLWAGDAAGGRGPERHRATGPTTTRPPGAGRRVSPEHQTRRALQVNSTRRALVIYYSDQLLIFFRRVQPLRFGDEMFESSSDTLRRTLRV